MYTIIPTIITTAHIMIIMIILYGSIASRWRDSGKYTLMATKTVVIDGETITQWTAPNINPWVAG